MWGQRKPEPVPKVFFLQRHEDETGVSGTGAVAWGVEFPDGTCALRWNSDLTSTAVYKNLGDLVQIHGHGGKTEVVWQ